MDAPAPAAVGVAPPSGLTTAEAAARRRAGEVNTPVGGTSRSYATILRTNVFSFYNTILFVIGAALLAMGRWNDAFVSVGLGLVNAVISAAQEIGAKRKLDGLQLLDTAPVIPALALWFATLTAMYRLRLLDRILGLDQLP
jgi:cation-transporting ATPase E